MPKARYKKDGKGLYYANVPTAEFRADGYRKYKKLRAKTQAELDKKVQEYNELISAGVTPGRTYTVDEWFEVWFEKYKGSCADSTRNFYRTLYRVHIGPAIGKVKIGDVLEVHAQGILATAARDHAQKTVKSVRSVLYSLFQTAARNRLIRFNPCAELAVIGGKRAKERRALTPEEREAYLAAIPGDPFGTFAALIYFFGLRRGEALALTGADVHRDHITINKQITYPGNNLPVPKLTPKTDAGFREIPIPERARKYIDFDALPDGLIISNPDGTPLSYTQVIDRWHRFLTAALGEDSEVTIHWIRHDYCTRLFEADVDLLDVRAYAGHTDVNTTLSIYTHYTETLKRTAARKVFALG